MKRMLVAVLVVCAIIPATAQTGPYLVNYFSNNGGVSGAADQYVRLINFGRNGSPVTSPVGDVCANIYVFDAGQNMSECCSCRITPNGLLQLAVAHNLTSNPLTFLSPPNGDIKILSTEATGATCLPTSLNGGLLDSTVGFATHLVTAQTTVTGQQTVSCTGLSGPTELTGDIVCPQFDDTGGLTLTQITLTITGTIDGSIQLTNNNPTNNYTASSQTSSQYAAGALPGFAIPSPLLTASFDTGPVTLGPKQSQLFNALVGTQSATLVNTTVFAPYTGAGTFSIPIDTSTTLTITGAGGNIVGEQHTEGSAVATLTYSYFSQNNAVEVYPVEALLPGTDVSQEEVNFLLQGCQFTTYLGSNRGVCNCRR